MSKSDLVDIAVHIHHQTERAVLISELGDREKAVWIPLAHCELEWLRNGTATLTLPEWLALDKGLI